MDLTAKDNPALEARSENIAKPVSEASTGTFREWAKIIGLALILVIFIRIFVVQAYKIPSGSMLPTLQIGDQLLVVKFIYGIRLPTIDEELLKGLLQGRVGPRSFRLHPGKRIIPITTPKRGDVIVFVYPVDKSKDFIKRVVAVAGDKVEIRNKKVFINGRPAADEHAVYDDPALSATVTKPRDQYGPTIVPPGKLFVMGDNRDNSHDSRFWGFVDVDAVVGKALVIYWSWDSSRWRPRWERLGDLIR